MEHLTGQPGMASTFRDHRETLGWSHREIARRLGCSVNLPLRWESGRAETPPAVLGWLERLARHIDRHPPPPEWRVR
jgi:transcriptional regulator with XRE-family HTH domain